MPIRINPAEILSSKKTTNNAGGIVYSIDKWKRLERYLIIGSEGGTYYVSPRKNVELSNENILRCLEEDSEKAINMAVRISDEGLAPKNDQAIFLLAVAISFGDAKAKKLAEENLVKVARTASHFTMFIDYVSSLRGWGKVLRRTAAGWYKRIGRTDCSSSPEQDMKNLKALVFQLMKYANRNGYSHRDILRLCHIKADYPEQNTLFSWITHPNLMPEFPNSFAENCFLSENEELYRYALAKQLSRYDKERIAELVVKYNLPHEVIPTAAKNDPEVWQALIDSGMPLNAMIRNLNKLTSLGLLKPFSENSKKIRSSLANEDYVRKSRLHPINILNQMKGYESGSSMSGLKWDPVPEILAAMEDAFYLSFANVNPSGKNIMLALDVSSSMSYEAVLGMNLSAAEVSAAMTLVTLRSEENCIVRAFADSLRDLKITKNMDLSTVLSITRNINFGATNCSLPMIWASQNNIDVDVFHVYTDNETWYGSSRYRTPADELRMYRDKAGKPEAKLAVIATTSNNVSIADPDDAGMLDIAGFSSAAPQVLAYFASM